MMITYQPRHLAFKEYIQLNDWSLKVYTISKQGIFDQHEFYENVLENLPKWLDKKNGFDSNHNFIGFLILHAGTEGIFSLINWWVGQNMLNTHIYLSKYDELSQFELISGEGLAPCVWELEIISHEHTAWMKHMLKCSHPNKQAYLHDMIGKEGFYL